MPGAAAESPDAESPDAGSLVAGSTAVVCSLASLTARSIWMPLSAIRAILSGVGASSRARAAPDPTCGGDLRGSGILARRKRPQQLPGKGLGDRFGERVGQGVGTGQAVRPARCTRRLPAGPPGHHLGADPAQRRPGRAVPVGARAGVPAQLPAFGFDDDADGAQQPLADLRTARDAPACAARGHVLGASCWNWRCRNCG